MGLYLYCFSDPDRESPEDLEGVDGAPVSVRTLNGLGAWVSEIPRTPAASLERIREHNAVVAWACGDATVVPVRFGQWFEDAGRLGGDVAARREGLVRALDRVRGAMEVGVRILARDTPATPVPDRSSGRAYMESLVRRTRQFDADRQRGEAVAKELGDSLAGVIREQRVRALESGVGLAAVAYLVPRHDIGECQQRVRTFAGTRPDLDFQISGPWPPYGFVDDGQ